MNDQLANIKIVVMHFTSPQTDLSFPPVHPHLISRRLWATFMCWSFSFCFSFSGISDTAVDITDELIYNLDTLDWSLYFLAFCIWHFVVLRHSLKICRRKCPSLRLIFSSWNQIIRKKLKSTRKRFLSRANSVIRTENISVVIHFPNSVKEILGKFNSWILWHL